jgi:hypothetical protein
VMAERCKHTIEHLTGRTVVAFLSQTPVDPDITVECSSWTGHCRDSARSKSSSQSGRSDQPASGGFAESI